MPSVRLTIIVRLDQAGSLDGLQEFVEKRRTAIGTDVSVLLSAADGPAATKLFSDLGTLAIPFEATATIGDIHYLVAGDGNQTGGGHPSLGERGMRKKWKTHTELRITRRSLAPNRLKCVNVN